MSGGMRGKVADPVRPEVEIKNRLVQYAIHFYDLSYSVGKFSGRERWRLLDYDTKIGDDRSLTVTDRDTDVDVVCYAAAGVDWHGVMLEYYYEGEWHQFKPQMALVEWRSGNPRWQDCAMPEGTGR